MSPLIQLAAPYSATLATALVAAAWQGTLLVLFMLAGLRLVPAISAAARSLVWLAALVTLTGLNVVPLRVTHHASNPTAASGVLLHADPRWSLALAAIWATLSLLRAVQLLRSVIALHSLSRRATPLAVEPAVAALLQRGRAKAAQLCDSSDVDRPSVVGFFTPKILLPLHLAATLSPGELEPILRHEMEHLRRRDDWTNLLQKLALTLFPLSPALLWVERRLCLERELACDDGVLRATGARKAYATCLANLAEHSLLRRSLTLALAAWDRRSALELRIRRILQPATNRMTTLQTAAAVLSLLAATTTGSLLAVRAPQLVSFQPPSVPAATAVATTHAPGAAHITLTSALMPQFHKINPSALRHMVRTAPRRNNARLTLTRWQQSNARASQPLATEPEFVFTYAAVRVPDGWLIIQL